MFIDFQTHDYKRVINKSHIVDIKLRNAHLSNNFGVQMRTFYNEQESVFNFRVQCVADSITLYDALCGALDGFSTEIDEGTWVRSRG